MIIGLLLAWVTVGRSGKCVSVGIAVFGFEERVL
jgi:hypothetical protein